MAIDYEEIRKLVEYGIRKGLIVSPEQQTEEEHRTDVKVEKSLSVCGCGNHYIKRSTRSVRCDDCLNKVIQCVICGTDMKIRYKNSEEYVKCCSSKECLSEHLSRTKKQRDSSRLK